MTTEEQKQALRDFARLEPKDSFIVLVIETYCTDARPHYRPLDASEAVSKQIRIVKELLTTQAANAGREWYQSKEKQLQALRALRDHYNAQVYGATLF